jgi:hypothetical protein
MRSQQLMPFLGREAEAPREPRPDKEGANLHPATGEILVFIHSMEIVSRARLSFDFCSRTRVLLRDQDPPRSRKRGARDNSDDEPTVMRAEPRASV